MPLSTTIPTLTKTKAVREDTQMEPPNHESTIFGEYTLFGVSFQQPLKYTNTILISLYHFVFLYAIITYPWIQKWKLGVFSLFYGYCGGLGITAGVHRYFTHRSFKANTLLKIILLILYASAGHNKLHDWVRDHRVHHKYSETDADPHNSRRGFFFAHVGWLMMKKHPDVIRKGKTIDMSDITNDPLLVWFDRNFIIIKLLFCFILPTCIVHYILGESWYWSIMSQCFGRYILLLNFTWLVNSAAHLYGNKPYDQNINPRENLTVSWLGLGEGWHNYHHTFPWDYKASEFGKLNATTYLLNICGRLGWAYDFKYASDDLVKRVASKLGDGSHEIFGNNVNQDTEIEELDVKNY